MRGQRQAEQQLRFAAAGLAAVKQFIRLAVIGIALRPDIGHPHRAAEDGIGLRQESCFDVRVQGTEASEQFVELHRKYSK